MRLSLAVILVTLTGCGLLSGLDTLVVDGGASDATSEASPDAPPVLDAAVDVTDGAAVVCGYDAGSPRCFGQLCTSEGCCLANGTASCLVGNTGCSDKTLRCTSSDDCKDAAAPVCCLTNEISSVPGCPTVVNVDASVATTCMPSFACLAQTATSRVCSSDSQCTGGQPHCRAVVLPADTKAVFGVCSAQ